MEACWKLLEQILQVSPHLDTCDPAAHCGDLFDNRYLCAVFVLDFLILFVFIIYLYIGVAFQTPFSSFFFLFILFCLSL